MPGGQIRQRRLIAELEALKDRFPRIRLCAPDLEHPSVEIAIDVESETRHVRLSFPTGYPAIPPQLREIDRFGGNALTPEYAPHRLRDGQVCLFPHGNDSQAWNEQRLAVEAVQRYIKLLTVERSRGAGERALAYRDERRVFLTPAISIVMRAPGKFGWLALRHANTPRSDLFASGISIGETALSLEDFGDEWRQTLPKELLTPWVCLAEVGPPLIELAGNREKLDNLLQSCFTTSLFEKLRREPCIVLVRGVTRDSESLDAIAVWRPKENLRALGFSRVLVGHPRDLLFHRVDGVLQGRDALASTRVVMIGLGSLGSAVALALARAGIRRFTLVDPETLAVDNICRHVGKVSDIGRAKVWVVKDAIMAVNPEAEVAPIEKWFAYDLPWIGAGFELESGLRGENALIICTCAEGPTERQLNAFAVRQGHPVIFASALGAAEHGRIFRTIPGETPCYECILQAQAENPTGHPRFAIDNERQTGAEYNEPGLPGLGIDIGQIALITARLALQTIARVQRVNIGIPDEGGDHLLWTNRGEWIFDRSLQLVIERFERLTDCPVCSSRSAEEELSGEEQAQLSQLVKELHWRPDGRDK